MSLLGLGGCGALGSGSGTSGVHVSQVQAGARNAKNPRGVAKVKVVRRKYIAKGPKSEFGRGNTRGVAFGPTNCSVSGRPFLLVQCKKCKTLVLEGF